MKSVYCGRKTVNWSNVNSEKATKTEPLRMNCGRSYENQGKAAVTEAVRDGAAVSCDLKCRGSSSHILEGQSEIQKKHFDHF